MGAGRSSLVAGVVSVGLLGCLKLNPGFDEATEGDAGPSTTGTTTGTTGVTPTTAVATTESSDGTLDATSTAAVTASTSSTTGVPPDMSSGTTESTGGAPTACWDLGIEAWTVEPLVLDPPGSEPTLSPDALTMHWRAQIGQQLHVVRSTRADVDAVFPAGGSAWPALGFSADHPVYVAATQELFFHEGGGEIYRVPHKGGVWGVPTIAGGVTAFGGDRESHPNPTADGANLLFQRDDGEPFGQFGGSYNFYQIARDPLLHMTFPDVAPLKVTPDHPGLGIVVCPSLAPDGLHMFFSALESAGGDGDVNDGRVGVWYGRRDQVASAAWVDVTRSEQLRESGFITCPVSVSADGCHLTLALFVFGGNGYETRIARRG
jgi:hypothetical protein